MIHNTTYMGISQNFELVTALPIYDLDLKFSTRSSMPRDPNVDLPAALHLYLNHRRNRSNTKHVRDWHWFVEIDGNLVHKWHQKSMFKMTLPWKGVSLIWKGPIAYLVSLTISIDFHKPMSVPYSTCLILPGFLRWLTYLSRQFYILWLYLQCPVSIYLSLT